MRMMPRRSASTPHANFPVGSPPAKVSPQGDPHHVQRQSLLQKQERQVGEEEDASGSRCRRCRGWQTKAKTPAYPGCHRYSPCPMLLTRCRSRRRQCNPGESRKIRAPRAREDAHTRVAQRHAHPRGHQRHERWPGHLAEVAEKL